MGRTEAKRAVSRSTFEGIQKVTNNENESCKRLKITNQKPLECRAVWHGRSVEPKN